MDLSLVSIEEIADEIGRRSKDYVLAFIRTESGNEEMVSTFFSDGSIATQLGMLDFIRRDILESIDEGEDIG